MVNVQDAGLFEERRSASRLSDVVLVEGV